MLSVAWLLCAIHFSLALLFQPRKREKKMSQKQHNMIVITEVILHIVFALIIIIINMHILSILERLNQISGLLLFQAGQILFNNN